MTGGASGTTSDDAAIAWLLDSDPSIRWQVMRDLVGAPATEWQAERDLVQAEGWGAQLLALEDDDGQWATELRLTSPGNGSHVRSRVSRLDKGAHCVPTTHVVRASESCTNHLRRIPSPAWN